MDRLAAKHPVSSRVFCFYRLADLFLRFVPALFTIKQAGQILKINNKQESNAETRKVLLLYLRARYRQVQKAGDS